VEADRDFYKFAVGMKFKQCPHCNFWVEKSEGCDYMVCRCGSRFCYRCGNNYSSCDCIRRNINYNPVFIPQPIPQQPNAGRLSRKEKKRLRMLEKKKKKKIGKIIC